MRIREQRALATLVLTLVILLGLTTGVGHARKLEIHADLVTARDGTSAASATTAKFDHQAFLPVVIGQPAASFADDFERGASQWTPYTNLDRLEPEQWYWHPGGGYQGTAGYTFDYSRGKKRPEDALTMYLGAESEGWTDYRASTRFKVRSGLKVGLWTRGTYKDQGGPGQWFLGYYCMVRVSSTGGEKVQLMQMRTTEDRGDPPEIHDDYLYHFTNPFLLAEQKLATDVAYDEWHQLTVEVRGPNVKCWVDDELAIDFTDSSGSIFLNGTIGLYTFGGSGIDAIISFDDVLVEPLN